MARRKALRIREQVLAIQRGLCPYCNNVVSEPTNHHRDHNQHNNYEDNIIVCCYRCHDKMNTVETIFASASDRLRQEIVYSILRIAPPHLARELV